MLPQLCLFQVEDYSLASLTELQKSLCTLYQLCSFLSFWLYVFVCVYISTRECINLHKYVSFSRVGHNVLEEMRTAHNIRDMPLF